LPFSKIKMPIAENENTSMQAALQQIFYNLKYSSKAVATNELLVIFHLKEILS